MEIHALLQGLEEPGGRQKAITAALTLLGESYEGVAAQAASAAGSRAKTDLSQTIHDGAVGTASQYFQHKDPKGKTEELATAARYRELTEQAETHTKEQIHHVIKSARRNFDVRNFARDLGNAKTAKLFTLGKDIALSYAGQQYVDALPNRQEAKAARTKSKKGGRKAAKKVKA